LARAHSILAVKPEFEKVLAQDGKPTRPRKTHGDRMSETAPRETPQENCDTGFGLQKVPSLGDHTGALLLCIYGMRLN
jgi:hypothetical protein